MILKQYLFGIVLILFCFQANSKNITPVLAKIKPETITIIGETHQKPESIKFFHGLFKGYLKNNDCLTIALEIDSNQQAMINQVMAGQESVSDIEISDIIDHSAYRGMIQNLATLKQSGYCLDVIAIDAGDEIKIRRDEWMATQLTNRVGNTPILALLGGFHALKLLIGK